MRRGPYGPSSTSPSPMIPDLIRSSSNPVDGTASPVDGTARPRSVAVVMVRLLSRIPSAVDPHLKRAPVRGIPPGHIDDAGVESSGSAATDRALTDLQGERDTDVLRFAAFVGAGTTADQIDGGLGDRGLVRCDGRQRGGAVGALL